MNALLSRAMLERVLDAFTENLAYKGLSLGFAIAIWAWVQSSLVVESRVRVPVSVKFPKHLVPNTPMPDSLLATVEGPKGLVRTIDHYDPHVQIDLSDAVEGSTTIDYLASPVEGLPSGTRVTSLQPATQVTTLEMRRSKKLEVKAAIEGDPAHGWTVKSVQVTPDFVVASGPESITHAMTSVLTTVVDVSGIKQDVAAEVPLASVGSNVTLSWTTPARVAVEVEPVVMTRTFTDVPVVTDGATPEPATVVVTLEGHQDEIEALGDDALQARVAGLEPGETIARWGEKDSGTLLVMPPDSAPSARVAAVKPSSVRVVPHP
jgi:YbbR domain-containing protein